MYVVTDSLEELTPNDETVIITQGYCGVTLSGSRSQEKINSRKVIHRLWWLTGMGRDLFRPLPNFPASFPRGNGKFPDLPVHY